MAVSNLSKPNCVSFQNIHKKYETSTGKSHRFIPNVPQEFDCRIKAKIKRELLFKDLEIRDEEYKTLYTDNYSRKIAATGQLQRPPNYKCTEYLRTVEEKLFHELPAPIAFQLSQMKDSFRMNYGRPDIDEIKAPCELARCYVTKFGSEQQPAVPIQSKCFWKWTDPYVTVYNSEYVPYNESDDKITEKILTFYNKNEFDLPPPSGNKTMFDRTLFKNVLPVRFLTRAHKRVPNFGMQSEYQDHYKRQTFSYLYPYLQDRCTHLEDSLPPASRWQNLAPPGMYCSEYCNFGGLSVRRVVDQDVPKKEMVRTEGCCRI